MEGASPYELIAFPEVQHASARATEPDSSGGAIHAFVPERS